MSDYKSIRHMKISIGVNGQVVILLLLACTGQNEIFFVCISLKTIGCLFVYFINLKWFGVTTLV